MILYKTPAGHWTGTQADARAAAREESGDPKNWVEIDVPVNKAGLMEFLNEHRVGATLISPIAAPALPDSEPSPSEDDDPWGIAEELPAPAHDPHTAKPSYRPDRNTFAPLTKTVDEVVSVIHEAEHADLSNYFDAVIWRAKELQPKGD